MILPLILFGVAFVFLFAGVPVAFAFGGAAFLVAGLRPRLESISSRCCPRESMAL